MQLTNAELNEALADALNCEPRTVERWRYHNEARIQSLNAPTRLAIRIMQALTGARETIVLRGRAWELELSMKLRPCKPRPGTGRQGASGGGGEKPLS